MSHITNINLTITNMDALKAACEQLGLEVREGQTTFRSYYGTRACAHAIGRKGDKAGYEIALMNPVEAGGGFGVTYDTWGPGAELTRVVGQDANRLKQEYAVAVTEQRTSATLARKGFRMQRENLPNGSVRLRLRKR